MAKRFCLTFILCLFTFINLSQAKEFDIEQGPYPVAFTQLQISKAHHNIDDEQMELYLKGDYHEKRGTKYISDILKITASTLVTSIKVPNEAHFGPHAGDSFPLAMYVAYPTTKTNTRASYEFPYGGITRRSLPHMQRGKQSPILSKHKNRYPLIISAHGRSAHAAFNFQNAITLASHGYIVAALFYGDDRLKPGPSYDRYKHYMRPLITRQSLDYLLYLKQFKPYIDDKRIGASGHSFGGFTILALAGGNIFDEGHQLQDKRIKAALVSAPWVGSTFNDSKFFVFGKQNHSLSKIRIPLLGVFGSKDSVTPSSYVLPALAQSSGPRYIVELVDQAHVYDEKSWQDQQKWELLFFDAYLKRDKAAMKQLQTATHASGGGQDRQLFKYQQLKRALQ